PAAATKSVPAREIESGGNPALAAERRGDGDDGTDSIAARHSAFRRRDRGATGPAGIVPLVQQSRRAADGFDFAETLSAAAHSLAELGQDRQAHREGIRG